MLMKNFFFSLMCCLMMVAVLPVDSYASPPPDGFEDMAITMRVTPHLDINADSMGVAIIPGAVGLLSQGQANVILYKIEDGNIIAVMGNVESDDGPVGIRVSGDGDTVFINSQTVVIHRKTFQSHQEADAALIPGEEYFLAGDRSVYRRP